jgi:hypothetical protein
MNIVIDDLGELSASGARAIEYRDTIYVDEGLPESERATVLALADAHRARNAKGTAQEHVVPLVTMAADADRFVGRLVAELEGREQTAARGLAAIDQVVSREVGTPHLRVLVVGCAARKLAEAPAALTATRDAEGTAFVLLSRALREIGDDAGAEAWLDRAAHVTGVDRKFFHSAAVLAEAEKQPLGPANEEH